VFYNRLVLASTPLVTAEWLERVHTLAPLVEGFRDEGERQRRLPRPLFEELRAAGLFSLWVPRSLGGAEVDVETSVRVVEELSRLDGAVGWNVMIAGNTSILWANLKQDVALDMAGEKGHTVIAGTVTSGSGTAISVPGGFRVSGRWPFASGCHQADWLVCVGHIVEDGEPRRAPDGSPRNYTFVLPAPECEILDTWYTVGMRATGSHDFMVSDLFVPEGRHFAARGAPSFQAGALYNTHIYHVWAPNLAAVALGIARAALDLFIDLAATKRTTRSPIPLAERESVQEKFGRAEGQLRSTRTFLYETISQTWQYLGSGRPVPDELTALNRLAASLAVDNAISAVDAVFTLSGSTSIYDRNRIERCFRDVHVVQQHAVVSLTGITVAGGYFLGQGLPPR
jgi:alkylation response protein AidB-like acyl-CoA dehydrogenase